MKHLCDDMRTDLGFSKRASRRLESSSVSIPTPLSRSEACNAPFCLPPPIFRDVDEAEGAVDGLELDGEATLGVELDAPSPKCPPPLGDFRAGLPAMGLSAGRAAAAGASSTTSENITLPAISLLVPPLMADAGLDAVLPIAEVGLDDGGAPILPCLERRLPPSPTPTELCLDKTLPAFAIPDPGLDVILPEADLETDPWPAAPSLPESCLEGTASPPSTRLLRQFTETLLRLLGETLLRLLKAMLPRRLTGMLTVGV